MLQKDKTTEIEKRFSEVIDKVIQTAEAKGWETKILNADEKKWKYASIHVRRHAGSLVECNFDITIDNGVVNYHHQRWWLIAAGYSYKGDNRPPLKKRFI